MFKKSFKIPETKPKVWNKAPKIHTFSLNPKYILKAFLRWLKLRDEEGELLVKEETDIDEIIKIWNKELLLWLATVFGTGALIQIAILPFYPPAELKLIPFTIFSFGLLYYIVLETLIKIRSIIKRGDING